MNIAFLLNSGALAPIRSLVNFRWSTKRKVTGQGAPCFKPRVHLDPQKLDVHFARSPETVGQARSQSKPLRVVRVFEAGQHCASVGRMVISGRMADVCAELERLAAGEAEVF
jgi:hypothetical protein